MILPPAPVLLPASVDFYVGTYTDEGGGKGIYRVTLDPASGRLGTPILAVKAPSPSYLAIAPNGRTVYAVHESEGTVGAYTVNPNGTLRLLNVEPARGGSPCHISVDPQGRTAFVANYGGSLAAFPILRSGSLGPAASTFENEGSGPVKERQEGSHMHAIGTDRAGRYAYACDLGTDDVLVFRHGAKPGEMALVSRAEAPPGVGPRHFVIGADGRFLYVNNEIRPSVTTYARDAKTGALREMTTVPTIRGEVPRGTNTAEIALHPNGKWLYVSNRTADTIAFFRIGRDGLPSLVEVVPAGVREPRGFALDPTGGWLVAAGERSGTVVALRVDPKSGRLKPNGKSVSIGKPVCIAFTATNR